MTRLENQGHRGTVVTTQGQGQEAGGKTGAAAAPPRPTPLRKAAILLVSLEQPLASQLLAQLDRAAVEAVTLEIARLDRIAPVEQQSVLEEFYGLGLRRLRFVFDDLARMDDRDIEEAYHDEDSASWAMALAGAARPVRAKVLARFRPPRPTRSGSTCPPSGRSGSMMPKLPRPRSPSGSVASTTMADSPYPTPTVRRRSLSDLVEIDDLGLLDGHDLRAVFSQISEPQLVEALSGTVPALCATAEEAIARPGQSARGRARCPRLRRAAAPCSSPRTPWSRPSAGSAGAAESVLVEPIRDCRGTLSGRHRTSRL